eukprot:3014171-Alexandrium_andersonii.AAC.1
MSPEAFPLAVVLPVAQATATGAHLQLVVDVLQPVLGAQPVDGSGPPRLGVSATDLPLEEAPLPLGQVVAHELVAVGLPLAILHGGHIGVAIEHNINLQATKPLHPNNREAQRAPNDRNQLGPYGASPGGTV